jgi:hypothetical protein
VAVVIDRFEVVPGGTDGEGTAAPAPGEPQPSEPERALEIRRALELEQTRLIRVRAH